MKKSKKILVGATLLASAAVLAGCKDRFQTLYGPPPGDNIEEPVPAPDEPFDPSNNQNEDLYGPPIKLPDEQPDEQNEETDNLPDFNPEENIDAPLYGPPIEEEEPIATVEPPVEEYSMHPTLYGPPPEEPSDEETSEEPIITSEFFEEVTQHQMLYGPPPSIEPPEKVIPENEIEIEDSNEE